MKGKRIKVSYNGEMKVVLIKDENYDYLLNSVRTSFNLLSDTEQYEFRWIDSTKEYITASSRDDILNAFDSKVSKFELVLCAVPEVAPAPVVKEENLSKEILQEPKEEKKEILVPLKVPSKVQETVPENLPQKKSKVQCRVDPEILLMLFKRFMSTDSCVVEIIDLVQKNQGKILRGPFTVDNYAIVILSLIHI
eukprot:TRINITY_DN13544_c0_g1_i2.p1 TRINITY_DN13544_c0_g1~~TRINITY_DN13544_c0_g1_i2.p1  ORF type:complete len:194 (+),score=35.71 TRINITY_DN13544_c0_g1_i2:179-760(+)